MMSDVTAQLRVFDYYRIPLRYLMLRSQRAYVDVMTRHIFLPGAYTSVASPQPIVSSRIYFQTHVLITSCRLKTANSPVTRFGHNVKINPNKTKFKVTFVYLTYSISFGSSEIRSPICAARSRLDEFLLSLYIMINNYYY